MSDPGRTWVCQPCGTPIVRRPGRGRPRMFCNDRCKKQWYRREDRALAMAYGLALNKHGNILKDEIRSTLLAGVCACGYTPAQGCDTLWHAENDKG